MTSMSQPKQIERRGHLQRTPGAPLSEREITSIPALVRGEPIKRIAFATGLSTNCVSVHLRNVKIKLRANTIPHAAVKFALSQGAGAEL